MKNNDDQFEGVFDSLQDKTLPTDEQKEKMLNYVLAEDRLRNLTTWEKAGRWITIYPWRFAFVAAAAQAIVLTWIFDTSYTNLFLRVLGG